MASLLLTACPLRAEGPALTPMATLTLDSPRLEYHEEGQVVEAQGPTTIRAEVQGEPQQRLLIETSQARADLETQRIQAGPPVEFIVPRLDLSGSTLDLDLSRRAYRLEETQAVADLGAPEGPPVLVPLQAKVIGSEKDVVFLENGYLAPCVCEDPDLIVHARRLEFNRTLNRFRIEHGSIELYGVRIPLLARMRKRLRTDKPESTNTLIPEVRYSDRDGFNIPYFFDFSGDSNPTLNTFGFTVTQKRGITFLGESRREEPAWSLVASASRLEDVRNKLTGNLVYSRLPEVYAERFQHSRNQDQGWHLLGSAGHFLEQNRSVEGSPEVEDQRFLLGLGYEWGSLRRQANQGKWAQLWATQALYGQGENFTDVAISAGAGGLLAPRCRLALTLTHHFTDGRTPFLFDEVDIRSEARSLFDLWLSDSWRVKWQGRLDLEAGKTRDYQVDLSKRTRCLTWTVYYHFVGEDIGLRFDINGITGDTAPPPQTGPTAEKYFAAQARLDAAPSPDSP